ncbi:hypothetical protein N9L45_00225, partial [Planctomycetota bacterium]|nr:hypothetical protein [Planctomycetota bacterium]
MTINGPEFMLQMQQHFGTSQTVIESHLSVKVNAIHIEALRRMLGTSFDANGNRVKVKGRSQTFLHFFRSHEKHPSLKPLLPCEWCCVVHVVKIEQKFNGPKKSRTFFLKMLPVRPGSVAGPTFPAVIVSIIFGLLPLS